MSRIPIAASLTLLIPAILTQGCAATIYRHRLPPVEGVLQSSDPKGVDIRIRGRQYRIPAEQIDDIDHPGNVLMVVGATMFAIGGTVLAVSQHVGQNDRDALLPSGLTYVGLGLGFIIGGGIPWAASRGAAMPYEYGPSATKSVLPIDCAPIPGSDPRNCTEPVQVDEVLPRAEGSSIY